MHARPLQIARSPTEVNIQNLIDDLKCFETVRDLRRPQGVTCPGRALDPRATSILLLCDGGGGNSASQYLFKEDLQQLVDRIGMEIRVAHDPPSTSKYNPIEHRLFPHLTRACRGVIFTSVELVKQLMEKATTRTGLQVTVDILDKVYQTGRKYAEGFKENMKIMFDEILPKWNYRAVPSGP